MEVVKMRKKYKPTKNKARPMSKQRKGVLLGSAQPLVSDGLGYKRYNKIK